MLDTVKSSALARSVHDGYTPTRGQHTNLHIDFETFSTAPLRVCGGYRYAVDKSTEILICCFAVDKGEVYHWIPCITVAEAREHNFPKNQFWFYGPKVPDLLTKLVADHEHTTIWAHNASFERAIWQAQVMRKHKGPSSKPHQFRCTAATASAANLPRSLDGVGMALDTKQKKDTENGKLLKTFCMPRKPTKNDPSTRVRPLERVEEFKRFIQYCAQDVRTERNVEKMLPPLHPEEQKLFTFDMQINERGLRIDIPLVRKAASIVARLESDIVAEVQKRTACNEYPQGLRPTQTAKMLKMFNDLGVKIENMQADHVRRYMKQNASSMTAQARELLMLRIEAGKSSTKKFASMLAYCADDHRARGTLLFYGASTGRWCLSEGTEVLVRTPGINNRGRARIRRVENILPTDQLWDGNEWVSHGGIVANGKRKVMLYDDIYATEDHEVWVDPDRKLRLGDAADLGIPVWQSWPTKCNMAPEPGKLKNLDGKMVKTFDVLDAGPRNRFTLFNGRVVSNSGRGIQPQNFARGNLKFEEQLRVFSLLEHNDHELLAMLYEWPITAIGSCMRGFILPSEGKILRVVDYAAIEARVLAWLALEDWVLKAYIDGLDVYRLMAAGVFNMTYEEVGKDSNERRIGKNLVLGCIARSAQVKVQRNDMIDWVNIDQVRDSDLVWDGDEFVAHTGVVFQGYKQVIKVDDGLCATFDHEVMIDDVWRRAIDVADEGAKPFMAPTFDITNCGPRSRFVVWTRGGGLIVHNCGYGLGGAKFVAYSEKAGVEIQESFAKAAVKTYRTKHKNIVRFWYDVERCSITAVREKRTEANAVVLRNLRFYCKDQWFCIELPNGRALRYYRPRVVPVEKFGEPALQLQFKTEFRGRLVTESTYGGKLVENITQAVARDILVCGMFNAEAAGYTVIGTVHDELLTEQLPDAGSVHELEKVVCILPQWAKGLPLKAEGFESYRYRK